MSIKRRRIWINYIWWYGLPASGKSTIAKEISKSEDAVIVSSDEIREELGNINDQSQNAKVFEEVESKIF